VTDLRNHPHPLPSREREKEFRERGKARSPRMEEGFFFLH